MKPVNKTLYIPLYGKACVSRKGILLRDPKAEEIWEKEGFALRGKAASRWLAYYMSMRAVVFDRWVCRRLEESPDAVVLHIGCGLDSRALRVGGEALWYDIDFPEVISQRGQFFPETGNYRMLGTDVRQENWLETIPPKETAIVVMEGVSMYLQPRECSALLDALGSRFRRVWLLMDSYTTFAAKASRYKNPINEVGVTRVWGMDDPRTAAEGTPLCFTEELDMTPAELVKQLPGWEQAVFRRLFAGAAAKKLYRLYEYRSEIPGNA